MRTKPTKLGWLLSLLALAMPAFAGSSGAISGTVKSADGTPQMGAAVEIFSATGSFDPVLLYTDQAGRFSANHILPGIYSVKVSAASFLPSLRDHLSLRSGAHIVVNLTVNTLFEAIQLLPARQKTPEDEDDWRWTLRSTANRPILRLVNDEPLVLVSHSGRKEDRTLKARVVFVAGGGAAAFGGSDNYTTLFGLDQAISANDTIAFNGQVGYANGEPTGAVRSSYSHHFQNGQDPHFAFTLRRSAPVGTQGNTLNSMQWSYSDKQTIADFIELKYGSELETVQFLKRVSRLRPFGSMAVHLSPATKVEYSYATAEPLSSFDRAFTEADLTDTAPRVSISGKIANLERACHQEVAVSHKMGKTNLQAAVFYDGIKDIALTGDGIATAQDPYFLPDYSADTFTYNGGNLHSTGLRLVMERKLTNGVTAILDYAMGDVIEPHGATAQASWQEVKGNFHQMKAHTIAAKMSGKIPVLQTRLGVSYKWSSEASVTQVDAFNASPGQADPFLGVYLHQPIPGGTFLPGKLEALVDVRNLLAEGYRPFLAADGHTLYLAQAVRAVRGGLAFTF